ncbi:ATP-dependent helicase HrpB [Cohnella fermenti]|uniref:ATP-dependent helicase HrpB n=1 Tax=Cohnella fermenti TaxID=2565925 RepID=A0A4S4BJS8_9BACL|nr:ATP-dependent helicase HrpB [Cohnella fermenti]THF74927.1 ATP-dependent helicase HrpB [Cohnella fermenti]
MTARMPVEQAIPELKEALEKHGSAVLVAEPGAGKTTRVPIALLEEPWLAGSKIIMLEPRKLAARNAARYMASTLGEKVGETVGYRVRMDTRVGPRTRIEVVTEGVLTRMLQSDPSLEEAGLVIFDEYHERSLQADLGLALALQCRALFREELRIAVMSATLEAEPVASLLGGAPVVRSEGRMYPVETRYAPEKTQGATEAETTAFVLRALSEQSAGDVLVFLPGAGEIRRVEARLRPALAGKAVDVAPLHGSLPQEAQDRALAPSAPGRRKVVLSTAVAESSLTVEGVTIVVDAGLMRVPRFSPRTGMARLETIPVSLASADQRRGRAGRLAPGVCYRLWTEEENRYLAPAGTPEIVAADLASLALDLAVWGVENPQELAWLDPPPAAAYQQARELLTELGALTEKGGLSPHGERMARLGVHPRLAHMLLRSVPLGLAEEAGRLAALLGERDLLRGEQRRDVDIALRLKALRHGGAHVDERVRERLLAEAAELARSAVACGEAGAGGGKEAAGTAGTARAVRAAGTAGTEGTAGAASEEGGAAGILLGFAYPDRIGRRRGPGRYTLSIGRGAELPAGQLLAQAEYVVVAELDDQGQEGRAQLAASLEAADLERHFASLIRREETVRWDAEAQAVRARESRLLGAIVLSERPLAKPSAEKVAEALLQGLRQEGLAMLPWSRSARQLQERGIFLAGADSAWPDWSDAALLDTLEDWLAPYLGGMKSRADLQRVNVAQALESSLSWEQRSRLDREAPTHIAVPSGSRIAVDYSDPKAPFIAVRLQEMFGLPDTPRIAGGRVPLTVHLLSPAQRPVQVTRDLASFWSNAYFEVRKDLKGRYPKHYWPDDPLEATATRRVRPPGS